MPAVARTSGSGDRLFRSGLPVGRTPQYAASAPQEPAPAAHPASGTDDRRTAVRAVLRHPCGHSRGTVFGSCVVAGGGPVGRPGASPCRSSRILPAVLQGLSRKESRFWARWRETLATSSLCLPVIAEDAVVESPTVETDPHTSFSSPADSGAREYRIRPDPDGRFEERIATGK